MRFSDLKKPREEAAPPAKKKPAPGALRSPEKQAAEPPAPEAPPAAPPEKQTAQAAAPQPAAIPAEPEKRPRREEKKTEAPFGKLEAEARETYSSLITQTSAFLKAVDQPYTEKYSSVLAVCSLATETLKTNPALLGFATYSTADDYLRGHTANTVIFSLAMGLEAGLDQGEMDLLGFCAMAHDIGMTEYSSLYNRPERLAEEEYSEMSLHAESGAAKLDRIVDIDYRIKERAARIILQTHEREDGTGYPDKVSGEEIDPLAQIISIADAYEAATHPRAWRDAAPPPEAIKELIEREGHGFNSRAVKLLISVVSLFPPGAIVSLSTGETARVLKVNRGLLTRPLVEILLAPDFSPVEPQLANLKDHPLVSIEHHISFEELRARNAKSAARLELIRWWTDW